MKPQSRRVFVKSALLATASLSMTRIAFASPGRPIPVALQLYSVRGDCAKDFDATLAQVATLGFDGVEFAGYYHYEGKAKELRKKLDELKLKAAGTHIGLSSLTGDALQRTIDFHQAIGCRFLVVPMDASFFHPEKSKVLAETFNKAAAALKPYDMYCGYHNHKPEFNKDGDKTYWDLFAERTVKEVVLQQDCGWTKASGLNPAELVRRYPGRTRTTHLKPTVVEGDSGKKAIFGQDSVDWAPVIQACREVGGTEWFVLEQEVYPDNRSPMECTSLSFAALKKALA
jgi:sugar phosphate isomerase/epimerase